MTTSRRLWIGSGLLAAGASVVLLGAGSATATVLRADRPETQVVTIGAAETELVPLMADGMYPGSTVVQRFRVRPTGAAIGRQPAVLIQGVSDLERECGRPEIAAGDTTCGRGQGEGELSSQLLGNVSFTSAGGSTCAASAAAGGADSLADLVGRTLTGDEPVTSDSADTCVTLTLQLPTSSDNRTQSDAVLFQVRLGYLDSRRDIAGRSGGGAARVLPPGRTGLLDVDMSGALPFTGQRLVPALLLAAGLLQVGVATLGGGRRRAGLPPL